MRGLHRVFVLIVHVFSVLGLVRAQVITLLVVSGLCGRDTIKHESNVNGGVMSVILVYMKVDFD